MHRFPIVLALVALIGGCTAGSDSLRSEIEEKEAPSTDLELGRSEDKSLLPVRVRLRGEPFEFSGRCDGYYFVADPASLPEVALLSQGNRACLSGETDKAIWIWQQVITDHPNTPAWNMAILNSGRVLQELGRHAEAISVLKLLLDDTTNYRKLDRSNLFALDLTSAPPMESYLDLWNNDWHDACKAISESFEALDDLPSARQFAVLARHKFPVREMCGVAAASEWCQLDDRIDLLTRKVNAPVETAFLTLAVAFAALLVWLGVGVVNRRKVGGARILAIVAFAIPLIYAASFGPACWIAERTAGSSSNLISTAYFPILRFANRSPRVAAVALWYARIGARNDSTPAFDGELVSWWETIGDASEIDDPETGSVSRNSEIVEDDARGGDEGQ
jgi:hypothetical protein